MNCHSTLPPFTRSFSKHTHTFLFIFASFCLCSSSRSPIVHIYIPVLCFLWKTGVKLFPPSSSHQCLMFREFPINPNGTISFTLKTNQGGALPRAPASPQASRISFHSHSGDAFSGPWLSGKFKAAWYIFVGPLVIAWGSLSDVCFMWKVIDSG